VSLLTNRWRHHDSLKQAIASISRREVEQNVSTSLQIAVDSVSRKVCTQEVILTCITQPRLSDTSRDFHYIDMQMRDFNAKDRQIAGRADFQFKLHLPRLKRGGVDFLRVLEIQYARTITLIRMPAENEHRRTRTKLNQDPIYRIIRTKQTSDWIIWIIYSRFPPHIMYSRSIILVMRMYSHNRRLRRIHD